MRFVILLSLTLLPSCSSFHLTAIEHEVSVNTGRERSGWDERSEAWGAGTKVKMMWGR